MPIRDLSANQKGFLEESRLAGGLCPDDGGKHDFRRHTSWCWKCGRSRESLLRRMAPGNDLSEEIRR